MIARPPTDEEIEQADLLHEESVKELDLGFLHGPFHTESEVSQFLGGDSWVLTKRFALLQGEEQKARIIDNCKESRINEAFGSSSHLALHDTDYIGGFLKFVTTVLSNCEMVVVPLLSGEVLSGAWHSDFDKQSQLLGRCVDLSKAFKQIAVSDSTLKFAGDFMFRRACRLGLPPRYIPSTKYREACGICCVTSCSCFLQCSLMISRCLNLSHYKSWQQRWSQLSLTF